PLGQDGAVDLGDELTLRRVEHHRLNAGDGRGLGIAEVHPEDSYRPEEEPDGGVVGEGREHGEEGLECLRPGLLLLGQANGDEEVGLVPVGLAPSRVADGAVPELPAALVAVLSRGWRLLGGSGPRGKQQSHREPELLEGSKVPHASPPSRKSCSRSHPRASLLVTRGASAENRWTLVSL